MCCCTSYNGHIADSSSSGPAGRLGGMVKASVMLHLCCYMSYNCYIDDQQQQQHQQVGWVAGRRPLLLCSLRIDECARAWDFSQPPAVMKQHRIPTLYVSLPVMSIVHMCTAALCTAGLLRSLRMRTATCCQKLALTYEPALRYHLSVSLTRARIARCELQGCSGA
jgi:hypothetical protein